MDRTSLKNCSVFRELKLAGLCGHSTAFKLVTIGLVPAAHIKFLLVMAGLVPAIHALLRRKDVDARHMTGHDRKSVT
jgi:hypothetical protein